jgi:uncharacterized repeat protein (TIGR04138 family)
MTMHHSGLAELVRRDSRYAYEAYEFIFEALRFTQVMLNRVPRAGEGEEPGPQHHVHGRELLEGIRVYAQRQYGLMAPCVFRMWGIRGTGDFGEIIFNLVDANLMSKTEEDCREDFHDIYDIDTDLVDGYRIVLDEPE